MSDLTIVAEISCNHMGKYDLAEKLVRAAKESGADAVKFQAFTPGMMTASVDRDEYVLKDGQWGGMHLHDLYLQAMTPMHWLGPLYRLARSIGITPFASVYHPDAVQVLEDLGTPMYKIASAEAGWADLADAVMSTGKPVLGSDGLVRTSRILGLYGPGATILRCVPEYPAHAREYAFADIAARDTNWGLSDHSMAPVTWMTAAALGASVIEAHLMLPLEYGRPLDANHSLVPHQFEGHARVARIARDIARTPRGAVKTSDFTRRWVYAEDLPAGTKVKRRHLVALRSSVGHPVSEPLPTGLKLIRDVQQWEPVR